MVTISGSRPYEIQVTVAPSVHDEVGMKPKEWPTRQSAPYETRKGRGLRLDVSQCHPTGVRTATVALDNSSVRTCRAIKANRRRAGGPDHPPNLTSSGSFAAVPSGHCNAKTTYRNQNRISGTKPDRRSGIDARRINKQAAAKADARLRDINVHGNRGDENSTA